MVRRKAWTLMLSLEDALDEETWLDAGRVVAFSVHLRHFDGRWNTVWRMDTAHGRLHVHQPDGRIRTLQRHRMDDYTQHAAEARRTVRLRWPELVARWRAHHGA